MKDEIHKLIKTLKDKIEGDCFNFKLHIDCCRIRSSKYKLKVRFDGCADRFFNKSGGCDCIFIFSDKVCLVECTTGTFGSLGARRKPKQIRECYDLIRSLDYKGLIVAIIYYESFKSVSKKRVEIELKEIKKGDKNFFFRFCKCGDCF